MGKLRDKMTMEMELRNLSSKTIKSYMWYMTDFTRTCGKSPADMSEEEIRKYLYHLKFKKKVSWSSTNVAYSALKFFYTKVLEREWNISKIPRPKSEKKLPIVLSCSEVKNILDAISNLKRRVILMTIYSTGLRINEATHLKIMDIDSSRMMIRVEQGKGKKDRYTLLSELLLEELRKYYKVYRPTLWLFPGGKDNQPISTSIIQRTFKKAKKKSE